MEHAQQVAEVLAWAGREPASDRALEQLERFASWLATEAIEAGGLGPEEGPSVWERHVLDSVMFSAGWGIPAEVVDIGSGVGLPGLPLAIANPDAQFVLVDRSGRRVGLIRRAIRVLGLDNATVVQADEAAYFSSHRAPIVVMRGVLQPDDLPAFLDRAVASGGVLVVGGGLNPEFVEGSELTRFPGSEVLAPGRWLRIMRRP